MTRWIDSAYRPFLVNVPSRRGESSMSLGEFVERGLERVAVPAVPDDLMHLPPTRQIYGLMPGMAPLAGGGLAEEILESPDAGE